MVQLRFSLLTALLSLLGLVVACSSDEPTYSPQAQVPTASQPYLTPQPKEPIGATEPARTVKVGLLLPLSGQAKAIGHALRDAAVMALFDKYATMQNPSVRVELITQDTQGTPEGAKAAATAAVREGASLLLGPLFARSVEAIKPLAKTGKVTIVSFSNNQDVAGDGTFLMGFDPAEQARRVANYAYRQDINTVAALVPNDAYGREVLSAFDRIAKLLGRKLKPVVRYSAAGATLNNDIRTLAKEGTSGARFTFGALLLPEGGSKLGPILGGLEAMNITSQTVQFIGTGQWDDTHIIRHHPLDGAWLASAPPEGYDAFEQRFRSVYNRKPPRLAGLAYDAVALAATLAEQTGGVSMQALTQPGGYYGPANGIFRFKPDGTIERGLAVLEVVGNQSLRVIDPAPTSFR